MKILFISTSNINVNGGDTIQLASEMNMWNLKHEVYYLSFTKLYNSSIVEDINENINLIFPTNRNEIFESELDNEKYVHYAGKIVEKFKIDLIVCRGNALAKAFVEKENKLYKEKCMVYITDIGALNDNDGKKIFNDAKYIKCQSQNYIDIISKKYEVEKTKFIIQTPIIGDEYEKIDKKYDIVYAGKIAPGWNIEDFLKYLEKNPDKKGILIYGRMVWYSHAEKLDLAKRISSLTNLETHVSLPRLETIGFIKQARVGYCYRDEKIDNDDSHEISTKLLEYMNAGVTPIVRKCKLHLDILSSLEYTNVTNYEELELAISEAINRNDEIVLHRKSLDYTHSNVLSKVEDQLKNKRKN